MTKAKKPPKDAPEPDPAPGASDEAEAKESATEALPETTAGVRLSANTWWCSNCGSGNRVGAEPEPACGTCGTPIGKAEPEE